MLTLVRTFMLVVLAIMPQLIKVLVYRKIFKYRIGKNIKLGIIIIDAVEFEIGDYSHISSGTIFWKCNTVSLGCKVEVGPLNLFRGVKYAKLDDYSSVLRLNVINAIIEPNFKLPVSSIFSLGYGSVITSEHRIDCTDKVTIGAYSVIGGRNSSIWTHNRRNGKSVFIGDNCYIGPETRFAPGARVPSKCIVGIGSVVVDSFVAEEQFLAGSPARHLRWLTQNDRELIFDKTRPDIPD